MNTKGAFFHSTFHSGSVAEVVDGRIDLLLGKVWLCPIENPPFVRTGGNAIPAADAPVVIHDDDPVRFLPGRMDRTNFYAGRILTVLALNGKINESLFRDQVGIVIVLRIFEIDEIPSLEPEDPDPLKLRIVP